MEILLRKKIQISPPQFLIVIFVSFILLGAVLLNLPIVTTEKIGWIDALFTATSAMTVTGLGVVDTGNVFTLFGQIVILSLIQIGGLGFMSFAVLIFMMLGKKIGMKQRLIIQEALNQTSIGGVIRLVKRLFLFSISIELLAVLFLSMRWVPEFGWKEGVYVSIFHSISAFNNAGFSIWSDSLSQYVGDPVVNIVITILFITGGLGFTVLSDLWYSREFKELSLHSKIMLIGTILINLIALLLVFAFEYHNPATLGSLSGGDKLLGSYFQAVTTRTAGFNTLDIGSLEDPTIILMLLLMFVGAGSASTGGGIKLTTFLIIFFTVVTFLKGKHDVVVFKKTIEQKLVVKSLAIFTISLFFVFIAILLLSVTEEEPLIMVIFEVVSAFGTVGLSMGLTFDLSYLGKVIIIFIMFLGKLGPLTLAFSLAKQKHTNIRYPKEDILAG
jgi:trk system potassium uptake protein TrkH